MLAFLGLGGRQSLARLTDKQGEIVAVVHVGDVEVILRSIIRRTHLDGSQQRKRCFGGLQIEAVVADKPEYLAVAVYAVVAKHLPRHDFSCTATLLGDVFHKVLAACHCSSITLILHSFLQFAMLFEQVPDAVFREYATLQVLWQKACLVGGKVLLPVVATIIAGEGSNVRLCLIVFIYRRIEPFQGRSSADEVPLHLANAPKLLFVISAYHEQETFCRRLCKGLAGSFPSFDNQRGSSISHSL